MESVLRGMGAERAADQVAYARHLDRLGSYGTGVLDWWYWGWEQVSRWVVGFGVYPFWVLGWVSLFVLVGTLSARGTLMNGTATSVRRADWLDCFWYSVENVLPLVEPSREDGKLVHRHWWTRFFFPFQKVMGFILATILVGALTLMGS